MAKTLTISPRTRPRKSRRRPPASGSTTWRRCWRIAGGILLLTLLLRVFVVQGYRVPSRSMEDTILVGEYLLVDKIGYGPVVPFANWRIPGWTDPAPGDLVVVRSPADSRKLYVKRCIAVAGQVVDVRNKVIYVDEQRVVDPPYSKYEDVRILPAEQSPRDNHDPVRVPSQALYVVGDNRDRSRDSRHWGPVPMSAVLGRARYVYWSCSPFPAGSRQGIWKHRLQTLPQRIRWRRLGLRVK